MCPVRSVEGSSPLILEGRRTTQVPSGSMSAPAYGGCTPPHSRSGFYQKHQEEAPSDPLSMQSIESRSALKESLSTIRCRSSASHAWQRTTRCARKVSSKPWPRKSTSSCLKTASVNARASWRPSSLVPRAVPDGLDPWFREEASSRPDPWGFWGGLDRNPKSDKLDS